MGDMTNKALKEYDKNLTGGSGKMGRNLNKDFSSWNDQGSPTYFKWVMSPSNINHKLFFFSKERKKLSCVTLIQNLLKIDNHTNSVLTGIDANLNIPKGQHKQLVLHKQDEHMSAFQRSARNQNPTEE